MFMIVFIIQAFNPEGSAIYQYKTLRCNLRVQAVQITKTGAAKTLLSASL